MASNFRADILEAASGAQITHIVIGEFGWGGVYATEDTRDIPNDLRGKVLTWDEAQELLDYLYHAGFGSPDCHAIYAWTATHVLFVENYDGSTRVSSVPKHPTIELRDDEPEMFGGG